MPTPARKGILLVLLAIFLVISVSVIPDIISDKMQAWCQAYFGEGYQKYLLGFFVLGSVGVLFLTTDIGKHLRPDAESKSGNFPPGTPDPDLVAKVRKYLTERYEHRLKQKMAGRQPVNLRILPSKTGTSQEGAENYITLQKEEVRAAIGDIFTRANNRLLLVGLPGAGKTTLVLQLALHLLERPGGSMAVVLNLATWRAEFKTFEEWLKKILPAELGASTGLAEQIRKHTPLILLLDGLDEVPEADRDSLLAAIGEYGADALRQFLISSRIAEYAATKDAPVNAQVEVAPLTVEQVEMGLAATAGIQPESKRLLNALKADPLLRAALENPFYLNTAQLLFSSGKNWSEFGFVAQDVAGRQRELVERFVEGALGRKVLQEYPVDKAGHWLSFLASRMTERNMVVFELRDLQYNWTTWDNVDLFLPNLIYWFINRIRFVIVGILLGVIINFLVHDFLNLYINKYLWLIIGGIIGALLSINSEEQLKIKTSEGIKFLWINVLKKFDEYIVISIIAGICLEIFLDITIAYFSWHQEGLFGRLIKAEIFSFLIGLIMMFLLTINDLFTNNYTNIIQITYPYQRFLLSIKVFNLSIILHLLLRLQLSRFHCIPFRLVTFLNALSARHILETDGATWRFRHRILQEYFAERWVEPGENKSKPQ